jgi:hypothetical protein
MKRTLICTAVALAFLWAGSVALAKDTNSPKTTTGPKTKSEAKEVKKTPTAEERRLEAAKKNYETEVEPWNAVLKVAQEEKATKTIAAIDKILKAKEEAYKKEVARIEKMEKPAPAATTKNRTTDKK